MSVSSFNTNSSNTRLKNLKAMTQNPKIMCRKRGFTFFPSTLVFEAEITRLQLDYFSSALLTNTKLSFFISMEPDMFTLSYDLQVFRKQRREMTEISGSTSIVFIAVIVVAIITITIVKYRAM